MNLKFPAALICTGDTADLQGLIFPPVALRKNAAFPITACVHGAPTQRVITGTLKVPSDVFQIRIDVIREVWRMCVAWVGTILTPRRWTSGGETAPRPRPTSSTHMASENSTSYLSYTLEADESTPCAGISTIEGKSGTVAAGKSGSSACLAPCVASQASG